MNLARRLVNSALVARLARVERGLPFWSTERIARLQRRRVRAIVQHAYTTVPFYRETMRDQCIDPSDLRTADDLARLPLLDAARVRADPDRFLSSGHRARHPIITSGSHAGVPATVWWDDTALLRKLAYLERDRAVLATLLGRATGHRQLYLLPEGSQSLALRAWWDEWTVMPPRAVERHFVAPEIPYERIAEHIDAIRPDIVFSYGSYAEHFGRWLTAQRVVLHAPRVWSFGGDALSQMGRAMLEQATGCVTYTTYQSAESGRIGFECDLRDGLHLNMDLCAVRLIDADGQPTAPGQAGEVVISNLHNRATVLLNYRLGDTGTMTSGPCACGRTLPLLSSLVGRQAEVIRLSDGRMVSGLVLDGLCNHDMAGALQAQVVCERAGSVVWHIVPAPGVDVAAMERVVRARVHAAFGDALEVSIRPVTHIPLTPQGKLIRVRHVTAAPPQASPH